MLVLLSASADKVNMKQTYINLYTVTVLRLFYLTYTSCQPVTSCWQPHHYHKNGALVRKSRSDKEKRCNNNTRAKRRISFTPAGFNKYDNTDKICR